MLQVQILYLANNNFAQIPTQLETFIALEEFSMADNHLSAPLPSFIQKWTNLSVLNLSNNNYDTWLNYGISQTLTSLDLSKNKINKIDETSFNGITSLSYIDISENRLYDVSPNLFTQTTNLEILILAKNYFHQIPNFYTTSLRILDLSNCQISSMRADSLQSKMNLAEINLSMNVIDWIPNNFSSNTLQILDLSYNVINTITDQTFSSLPHLAVLDLRGNHFKEIWWSSYFSSNPSLREIRVKGNRWSCEGFSINLLLTYEFLTRYPPKVADPTSLICYTPNNVTQLTWEEAYVRTWHLEDSYEPVTITAVMIGVVIGVVLTSCACRGLMAVSSPDTPTPATQNLNQTVTIETTARTETTVMRIALSDDLPPSYDEALLMPRLNSSFHSLPGFIDDEDEVERNRRFRRSRSIGDLVDSRPRTGDRRSHRPTRVPLEDQEEENAS